MIANRMKPVLLAAALAMSVVGVSAPAAFARDGFHSGHHGNGEFGKRNRLAWLSGKTLGSPARATASRSDTYRKSSSVRNFSSFRIVRGSSIIFSDGYYAIYLDRFGRYATRPAHPVIAPKAKVINVTDEVVEKGFKPVNGCTFEQGVCVIRGKN